MVTNCTSVTHAGYNHLDITKDVRQGKHGIPSGCVIYGGREVI